MHTEETMRLDCYFAENNQVEGGHTNNLSFLALSAIVWRFATLAEAFPVLALKFPAGWLRMTIHFSCSSILIFSIWLSIHYLSTALQTINHLRWFQVKTIHLLCSIQYPIFIAKWVLSLLEDVHEGHFWVGWSLVRLIFCFLKYLSNSHWFVYSCCSIFPLALFLFFLDASPYFKLIFCRPFFCFISWPPCCDISDLSWRWIDRILLPTSSIWRYWLANCLMFASGKAWWREIKQRYLLQH